MCPCFIEISTYTEKMNLPPNSVDDLMHEDHGSYLGNIVTCCHKYHCNYSVNIYALPHSF